MLLDDAAADVQPSARALADILGREVAVEYATSQRLGYAGTVVVDMHHHRTRFHAQADAHDAPAAVGRGPDRVAGIGRQVDEHLADLSGAASEHRNRALTVQRDVDVVLPVPSRDDQAVLQHGAQVDALVGRQFWVGRGADRLHDFGHPPTAVQ